MNESESANQLHYTWSDFFEKMQNSVIIHHVFSMFTKGEFKQTEEMLLSCICLLQDQNDDLTRRIIDYENSKPPTAVFNIKWPWK